jgi:hypothetical protein
MQSSPSDLDQRPRFYEGRSNPPRPFRDPRFWSTRPNRYAVLHLIHQFQIDGPCLPSFSKPGRAASPARHGGAHTGASQVVPPGDQYLHWNGSYPNGCVGERIEEVFTSDYRASGFHPRYIPRGTVVHSQVRRASPHDTACSIVSQNLPRY